VPLPIPWQFGKLSARPLSTMRTAAVELSAAAPSVVMAQHGMNMQMYMYSVSTAPRHHVISIILTQQTVNHRSMHTVLAVVGSTQPSHTLLTSDCSDTVSYCVVGTVCLSEYEAASH
jgi:hypothetical protein